MKGGSRSFKIRKSVYDVANRYRRFTDLTWGGFIEEALVLFMDLNPVNGAVIIVENQRRTQNIDDWMQELICIDELEEFILKMNTLIKDGTPIHQIRMKQLLIILKNCKKVKERSDKLDILIDKARRYFE